MTKRKVERITGATITLRQIESLGPCGGDYEVFIHELKIHPVPDGDYHEYKDEALKKSKFGPDSDIPLTTIARMKNGSNYVNWLIDAVQDRGPEGFPGMAGTLKAWAAYSKKAQKKADELEKLVDQLNEVSIDDFISGKAPAVD